MSKKFHFQIEKFNQARRVLMLPHAHDENQCFAFAFQFVNQALKGLDMHDFSEAMWINIERIRTSLELEEDVDSSDDEPWKHKIAEMTYEEKLEFSNAVYALTTWFEIKDAQLHRDKNIPP